MPRPRQGNLAETAFLHRGTALGFRIAQPFGNCERYGFIVAVSSMGSSRSGAVKNLIQQGKVKHRGLTQTGHLLCYENRTF